MIDKFLEAMDDEKEYDFIATNHTFFSKNDLKNLLLEYIYAAHCEGKEVEDSIRENVRGELQTKEVFG